MKRAGKKYTLWDEQSRKKVHEQTPKHEKIGKEENVAPKVLDLDKVD